MPTRPKVMGQQKTTLQQTQQIVNLSATAIARKSQQSMNSIMNKFDFKYQL